MTVLAQLRAAIAAHHTDTSDGAWDGAAAMADCPADADHLRALCAWVDPDADAETKAAYRFAHHEVSSDDDVGAANDSACSSGIAVLNGGRGGTTIPHADRKGVWRHLATHLRDAHDDDPDYEPPALRSGPIRTARRSGGREERVFALSGVEVRADGDGTPRIVGHAAVYNSWSQDLGGFKERVLPGAFTKSLLESDVRALFNHDPNYVLGRTKSGTLSLSDEAKGLHIEAEPPDTQTIRDLVLEPMRRGDIDQMSFSFTTVRDEWREPKAIGGLWERDLVEARLYDVSPVTFPAYLQTDVGLRSLLTDVGLDFTALTALIARAERGLTLTDSDQDLIAGSIAVLRGYLPEPATPEPALHLAAPDAERSSIAHLRRMLDWAEAAS